MARPRAPLRTAKQSVAALLLDHGYRGLRASHLLVTDDGVDGRHWTIDSGYFEEIYGEGEQNRRRSLSDAPHGYVHADGSIEGPYGGTPPPEIPHPFTLTVDGSSKSISAPHQALAEFQAAIANGGRVVTLVRNATVMVAAFYLDALVKP